MSIFIVATFTRARVPATLLAPDINIYDLSDDSLVISGTMTHILNGVYKYEFTGFTETISYLFEADGIDDTLDSRYHYGSSPYIQDLSGITATVDITSPIIDI